LGDYFSNDNGGVVIWHIDKNIYKENYDLNSVNNTDHRPSVMPLYPEKVDSKYTYTGKGGVVYCPFYDSNIWNSKFSPDVGDALELPLYAKGKNANKRIYRTLSGIKVSFQDNSSNSMVIGVNLDDHVHAITHLNKAATCTKYGYIDCYYCSYCYKFFSDSAYKNEITASEAIIPATGHSFVFSKTVKPMADEDGYDLYVCEHCGEEKKENFKKLVGWGYDKNGNRYYAKADGTFLKGWQKLNSKLYYFNRYGIMATNWARLLHKDGNYYYYYFGSNGVMRTGWQSINNSKGVAYKYYFGTNGIKRTGWQNITNSKGNTYRFYFGDNGAMRTNWQWITNSKGVKYRYYFGSNGVMRTGWQKIKNAKGVTYLYYFYSNGVNAIDRNVKIGKKTYKFNKYGVCVNY
jgi:glucan-binding YG repeat protein